MKSTLSLLRKPFIVFFLILFISACSGGNGEPPGGPWNASKTLDTWLSDNPYDDFHDGGWVYSAREDVLYSMYGNDDDGTHLYRIDHIGQSYSNPVDWIYDRHGSHPVIDDDGIYVYQPPSESSEELERYNTQTDSRETMASAPTTATYIHGAWKNGELWIVLDDYYLYRYNPSTDTWYQMYYFDEVGDTASSASGSDLIYIILNGGDLYSYDTVTDTVTSLTANSHGYELGGNGQFVWFSAGSTTGYLYATSGCNSTTPAVYDIANDTWHDMRDPVDVSNANCNGHATYDSTRDRLYVVDQEDPGNVYYYQF